MAGISIRTQENIGKLVKTSSTTVQLPAGSRVNIGGMQYINGIALSMSTGSVGVGGLDAALTASSVYYVYAIVSSGNMALIGSKNSSLPSGYTQAKMIGIFATDAVGALYSVGNRSLPISSYNKKTKWIDATSYTTPSVSWSNPKIMVQFFADFNNVWSMNIATHAETSSTGGHYFTVAGIPAFTIDQRVGGMGYTSTPSPIMLVVFAGDPKFYYYVDGNGNSIVWSGNATFIIGGEPTWSSLGTSAANVMEDIIWNS